jgi:hypothetical protein
MRISLHHLSVLFVLAILFGCQDTHEASFEASLDSSMYAARQMDNANQAAFYHGTDFYDYLSYELKTASSADDFSPKPDRLSVIFAHVDSIEYACAALISLIEDIKTDLLKKEAENITKEKPNDPNVIVWRKYNPEKGCLPSNLNLFALKQPETSHFVNIELLGDSDLKLSRKGQKLWNALNAYRRSILKHTGSYNWGKSEFNIQVKAINQFADRDDLVRQVSSMVDASKANLKEDRQVLIDLYIMLTKPEFVEKNGNKMHWMNSMFKDAPIVSAIASLSALENEILHARSLAYMHWRSKRGHCCYGFNQIIPVATGPSTIKEGEELEIKVSIVAFDSDKQPVVTIEGYESHIDYDNGLGIVTVKPKKGLQTIRGTVTIKNNAGTARTEPWEWTVNVLDK